MKRNLIVLGCAGMLAFGLSLSSFAGSAPDADSDGVPDLYDNCSVVANGPLLPPVGCKQQDGDTDGYGNACDRDLNNNGTTDLPDLGLVLSNLGNTLAPAFDINCNGTVDLPDLGAVLSALGTPPGPSGLGCAGTIPCFAQ